MKIHILSDLHIEFEPFVPPETDADIVVLAGDIHVKTNGVEWAKKAFPTKPVLYVIGNHEHYGEAIPKHIQMLQAASSGSNVQLLENGRLDFGNITFLGTTLWTDFSLLGDPRIAGYEANEKMIDYRKIRVTPGYRKLRASDTAHMHATAKTWLVCELARCKERVTVVITHHAPSKRSVPCIFQQDILSAAYASDLDHLVSESNARLWIHGHMHERKDYFIGNTRVVCNPRGYPDELTSFQPGLVLEV